METRESVLNDAVRDIITESNYNPHYAPQEERLQMETKLFLARFDALMKYTIAATPIEQPNGSEQWQDRQTQEIVTLIGRGLLQTDATTGTRLVAYREEDDRVSFILETEFHRKYEVV